VRHLVTGGSGFLGNLIARRLRARGEDVAILDIWDDPTRPRDIAFINADIRDRDKVRAAMQGVDVVHHNVALVPLTKSGRQFWEVNVDGSRIAAEEAVKAGVRSFVHMSSSAIFGAPKVNPVTLDTPPHPIEIYGRGKLAGELAVRDVCEKSRTMLIVVRPRTILGEGRLGIFQILFDWIADGTSVYTLGSGNVMFQFIHAHDLMDAYVLALDANKPGVYNVGTDRFGTLRESLERLIAYAGTASKVRSLPHTPAILTLQILDKLRLSPLAPWHYLTYGKAFHYDVSALHALGWKAKYSNDEMFKESYDWFLAHRDEVRATRGGSAHRTPVRELALRIVRKLSG
jgi:nucleoside-diphosphate-sugar epimerase